MKLRFETKDVIVGEDIEFPDHAYCLAYSGVGIPKGQQMQVTYAVPSDEESANMTRAMEIVHHMLGLKL